MYLLRLAQGVARFVGGLFGAIWKSLRTPYPVPPYDSEWEKDYEWYQTFQPSKDTGLYSRLKDDASERYKELVEVFNSIDSKAEWVFGIAIGGLAGVFAAVLPWKLPFLSILPTVAALLVTMWVALRCRIPNDRPAPMTVQRMMKLVETYPAEFDGIYSASTHMAIEGLKRVNKWKTLLVRGAVYSLLVGALGFIFPLGFLEIQRHRDAASNRSKSCQLAVDARQAAAWVWDWEWRASDSAAKKNQNQDQTLMAP